MSMDKLPEVIKDLKKLARTEVAQDECAKTGEDFIVDDYASGNVDDAFSMGELHGTVDLAREILTTLGINWE